MSNDKKSTYVSVSVNQLMNLTSSDYGLVVQRQLISGVCVVGKVEEIIDEVTKITYILNDYTGKIAIYEWKGVSATNFSIRSLIVYD